MNRLICIAVLCAVALFGCATLSEATQYRIRDLGGRAQAMGINDSGQVVGVKESYVSTGFVWDAIHGMQMLNGAANDINSQGQIVGSYEYDSSSHARSHACLWNSATSVREDLGTLGGDTSNATGINDAGQITGGSSLAGGGRNAFIWKRSTGMQDLGTINSGAAYPYAINSSGQIAGEIIFNGAFIWDSTNHMQNIGNLGGTNPWASAYAINDGGQVVGYSPTSGYFGHAFIWSRLGGMVDIGTFGLWSSAWGINSRGVVVGEFDGGSLTSAFVWNATDGMIALPSLGGTGGSGACSINSQDMIAGYSYGVDGFIHAVVWEPVPEPSSILALLCGIGGLGGMMLKRKQ